MRRVRFDIQRRGSTVPLISKAIRPGAVSDRRLLEPPRKQGTLRRLARWCMIHRRRVIVGWITVAILATVVSHAVGPNYVSVFGLPGTESQRASDLLKKEFKAQSGDVDTIVFHVTHGTVDSPALRAAITPLLTNASRLPHVAGVVSPYGPNGAVQVSANRTTAFATVNYDKAANLLPTNAGKPLLEKVEAVHVPDLQVAAGGQVVEQAEGFSVGSATGVGVIAALLILLLTFGSLAAAGMPLITAGLGLITGVALIGLATHVTNLSNISPDLALMIGLGVGIDYALFIVTRFRESYLALGDLDASILEAMDTSARAVLLAGATVVIALLGMFATGVAFMYGLAIAAVIAVLLTLVASLTLLPALLSRFGPKLARPRKIRLGRRHKPQVAANGTGVAAAEAPRSAWRRWSEIVQARPWPLAIVSLAVMVALLTPVFALRLDSSDAGNDPPNMSSRHAFDLLAQGFGQGFNGPLLVVAELPPGNHATALAQLRSAAGHVPGVVAVTNPRIAPSGTVAVMQVYPRSAPQALATTDLVNELRHNVLPPLERQTKLRVLVGGFTAASIDFSHGLASKLPLFFALVILLSALLLFVVFRSIVIPVQAAVMNLLSIGAAMGVIVAVFQWGWLGGLLSVQKGPIEPWVPVLMFAVVFGLSMDYEVFLVSRMREQWLRRGDASAAVADGISLTGRVITAAAAIMVCVFLSFVLGDERTLKEFGLGLAVAVFLDALVVRCMMLPAVLELLGPITWRLPHWLDARLPHINIEGTDVRHTATGPEEITESDSTATDPAVRGENGGTERFRSFFNPATGETIEFTATAEDGEDLVRFKWRSMPGGAITEHIHPHQQERFTIIAGEAHFTIEGKEHVLGPGESIIVPPGVRHSEGNPGSIAIEGIVELRPALHSKEMHEAFAGLAAEGKTTARGAPKNPLQLGATIWHFRHESRATAPAISVQNIMLPPLWALAKVFRVRPYHQRWDSRVTQPA
jgi:RND superfamily putative drug exporter